jgi:hypothetical protein
MKKNTFFGMTCNAYESLNALFNFQWPSAIGLWNLKWQMIGFKTVNPQADVKEINGKFAAGFGLTNFDFSDLLNADNQYIVNGISKTLLLNYFAIYEGWIEDISKAAFRSNKTMCKQLQFPSDIARTKGVYVAIDKINSSKSDFMVNYYYPVLITHKKYRIQCLNNLLFCYRVFKEMRNCIVHNNGKVSTELIQSYNNYCNFVHVPDDLGVKELPDIRIGTLGDEVAPSIRGLVCFSEILLILMTTLDAELSKSVASEKYILQKYKQHAEGLTMSATNFQKQKKILNSIIQKEHRLKINIDRNFINYILRNNVVFTQ